MHRLSSKYLCLPLTLPLGEWPRVAHEMDNQDGDDKRALENHRENLKLRRDRQNRIGFFDDLPHKKPHWLPKTAANLNMEVTAPTTSAGSSSTTYTGSQAHPAWPTQNQDGACPADFVLNQGEPDPWDEPEADPSSFPASSPLPDHQDLVSAEEDSPSSGCVDLISQEEDSPSSVEGPQGPAVTSNAEVIPPILFRRHRANPGAHQGVPRCNHWCTVWIHSNCSERCWLDHTHNGGLSSDHACYECWRFTPIDYDTVTAESVAPDELPLIPVSDPEDVHSESEGQIFYDLMADYPSNWPGGSP